MVAPGIATARGSSTSVPSSELFVHWVNVVILAEYHNPSILNPDFLAKKVVPRTWKVREAINTPAVANIMYENGVRFTVDQSRLEVRKDINDQVRATYEAFDLASRYVTTLPHVPYKSVGLNWQLSLSCPDANRWLLTRFYRPEISQSAEPEPIGGAVQLRYKGPSSICNIRFDPGVLRRDGSEVEVLGINMNFHHEEANTPRKIRTALEHWHEKHEFMLVLINKLVQGAAS